MNLRIVCISIAFVVAFGTIGYLHIRWQRAVLCTDLISVIQDSDAPLASRVAAAQQYCDMGLGCSVAIGVYIDNLRYELEEVNGSALRTVGHTEPAGQSVDVDRIESAKSPRIVETPVKSAR